MITEDDLCDFFRMGKGIRQGCVLSPYLFKIYGEYIICKVAQDEKDGFSVVGRDITELRYADDTTLIESAIDQMQKLLNKSKKKAKKSDSI